MEMEQPCALAILESRYLFPSFRLHKGESNTQNLCFSAKKKKRSLTRKVFSIGVVIFSEFNMNGWHFWWKIK